MRFRSNHNHRLGFLTVQNLHSKKTKPAKPAKPKAIAVY